MNVPDNLNGHVYYFEPNDLDFGTNQDGNSVPMIPHLEDLCISMSLTAEIRSRDKSKNTLVEKTISWVSYPNPKFDKRTGHSDHMVNGGDNFNGENFLTTYYTEISADKYVDHELIEGLGVTNVNISFESWYTPTITIDFVDVHGTSLWGREEAIHDNGDITADNLLGVFFTMPYPLFRLQVKGFLGKDVTYQLSVSKFNGHYNSQTGDFEATVQFIGYSYSLLTDIPLKCLSYVSELSYVGQAYWNENVKNNPKWQLIKADGTPTPPIKLYKLIENIKNAIGTVDSQRALACDNTEISVTSATPQATDISEDNQNVTLQQGQTVNEAMINLTSTNNLSTLYNNFIKELVKTIENDNQGSVIFGSQQNVNGSYSVQALLIVKLNNKKEFDIGSKACQAYHRLNDAIDNFNLNHSEKISNGIKSLDYDFHNFVPRRNGGILTITIKEDPIFIKDPIDQTIHLSGYTTYDNMKFVGKRKMSKATAKALQELVYAYNNNKVGPTKNPFPTTGHHIYAYLLPLGTTKYQIEKYMKATTAAATNVETTVENRTAAQANGYEKVTINDNSSETDNWLEETRKKKIIDILGFEPTIGNFVKLMMCHLETFIEVMMVCNERIQSYIDNGERTYENLSIKKGSTDLTISPKPYPWPALYNPNHKKNDESTPPAQEGNNHEVLGWPDDYKCKQGLPDMWEEKKVVLSIIEAIEKYSEEAQAIVTSSVFRYDGLPITGSDLWTQASPFSNVARDCDSIEKIATYLGLRAANVIGLGDNQCSLDDAKMLGYMDALNMISSYSKYDKLKEACKAKGTNQDFATQVIAYLTCDSKITPTNQTEDGKKYNAFETVISGSGNPYNGTRHPIFKKYGNKYTYSYIYTKNLNGDGYVSIVPTEILKFDGYGNPYNKLFESQITNKNGEKEKSHNFLLKINSTVKGGNITDTTQNFLYSCKSFKIIDESLQQNYTNEQLFYINDNIDASNKFIQQIEDYKNGNVKFMNYAVKGEKEDENLRKFMERKYDVSIKSYRKNYNDWTLLIPSLSEVDETYAKKSLCNSDEKKNDVKYDNLWLDFKSKFNTSKIQKKLKEHINTLNSTGRNDKLYIRELLLFVNGRVHSLFGSKFYYQQNLVKDTEIDNITKYEEKNIINKCKAYLILSSFMCSVKIKTQSVFKRGNRSFVQLLPPCYVLFLGALLWRRKFWDTFNKEPLCKKDYEASFPNENTSFIRKDDNILHISSTGDKKDYYNISDYYIDYEYIDIAVRNKLINLFENFVLNGDLNTIINNCELNSAEIVSEEERWSNWRGKWTSTNFKPESPSHWTNIFKNYFGQYSSICLATDKNGLRLLFNENNKAMDVLKNLYGLNGGYIVSRATTTRVGQGNNEISVTNSQLRGYLTGFAQRINDIETEAKKTEEIKETKDEQQIKRDICVSLYYSLKHLWDTWLVTADRNEFTIENFFNKNFVFIDSFYMNMYNVIKLNAEDIYDAYRMQDSNLLTFITNVTSKEGCMFFALPSFLDSNVTPNGISTVNSYRANEVMDFSLKKENMKKMFTPIQYNSIGSPQLHNTFVFIYTHSPSSVATENTEYRYDSYDMRNIDERPDALKVGILPPKQVIGADDYDNFQQKLLPNNTSNNIDRSQEEEELVSARYGYLMPCFGVTVNRGNNYIFKSINVNMDSPKITNVAAQTFDDILNKTGSDGSKRVFFHGQDIYSIYSQYSYQCEIEMMGCAQIQPLMYFQLLNIPMWRGTYMIYKVTHNLQAGMMTTKFTGMKMSRRQTPYADGYHVVGKKSAKTGKISVNYT